MGKLTWFRARIFFLVMRDITYNARDDISVHLLDEFWRILCDDNICLGLRFLSAG
jgi:hypothetical protein